MIYEILLDGGTVFDTSAKKPENSNAQRTYYTSYKNLSQTEYIFWQTLIKPLVYNYVVTVRHCEHTATP